MAHQSFWDTNARFKIQQVIKVLESIAEIKADFPICHVKSHNNIYSVYYWFIDMLFCLIHTWHKHAISHILDIRFHCYSNWNEVKAEWSKHLLRVPGLLLVKWAILCHFPVFFTWIKHILLQLMWRFSFVMYDMKIKHIFCTATSHPHNRTY